MTRFQNVQQTTLHHCTHCVIQLVVTLALSPLLASHAWPGPRLRPYPTGPATALFTSFARVQFVTSWQHHQWVISRVESSLLPEALPLLINTTTCTARTLRTAGMPVVHMCVTSTLHTSRPQQTQTLARSHRRSIVSALRTAAAAAPGDVLPRRASVAVPPTAQLAFLRLPHRAVQHGAAGREGGVRPDAGALRERRQGMHCLLCTAGGQGR